MAELTCNHSVDTFIQQRHRRGTEGGRQGSRKQREVSHINTDVSIRANGPTQWNQLFSLTCVLGLSEVRSASSPTVAPGVWVHQTETQTATILVHRFSETKGLFILFQRVLKLGFSSIPLTYQLNDLDENPVIGRWGHELEEKWGQRQVVLRVSPSQLTDNIYCRRLDT